MAAAVTRQEGDAGGAEIPDDVLVRGIAEGRLEAHALDVGQVLEVVQTTSADDTENCSLPLLLLAHERLLCHTDRRRERRARAWARYPRTRVMRRSPRISRRVTGPRRSPFTV